MEKNITYNFKTKLQSGKKVFGQMVGAGNDPEKMARALKEFDYDFFILDNEHCLLNRETVAAHIQAAREVGLTILLRPEENSAPCRCYLDAGINGLMLPHVDTVEEATYAVNQTYFPPVGKRGYGIGINPCLTDSQSTADIPVLSLIDYIGRNTVLFPMTESLQSIANLSSILSLEGITGTIMGVFDLALDIGNIDPKALAEETLTTDFYEGKLRQVLKICRAAGKPAGIGGFSSKGLARWAKEGYQLLLLPGYIRDNNVNEQRLRIKDVKSLLG